jgi:citronellol/citronellal dehydrogenase
MPYRSIFRQDIFGGRTIVVTGGGSGIGRCIAHELAALGAHVVLTGRKPDKLERVRAEIAEDGGSAECHAFDIREEEQVSQAIARVLTTRPRIDGLVNNAGGQFPAPLEAISQKGWDAVVRTNLTGGFLVARETVRQSMKENGGSIVNITADNWNGMPLMGHSGAARAGMANLTETEALEWSSYGVRVNAVAPGKIASSGLDSYDEATRQAIRTRYRHVPLNRFGTEAEVSAAVVFLLSDAAAYITGAMLRVDGGTPLARPGWPMPDHRRSEAFQGFHRYIAPKAVMPE